MSACAVVLCQRVIFGGCKEAFWDICNRWDIVYCEAELAYCILWAGEKGTRQVKVSQATLVSQPKAPPPMSEASHPPTPSHVKSTPPPTLLPRQRFPSRIITKTQCSENMFVEDKQGQQNAKCCQRTKAKCASHSLTQKLPLLSWPQGADETKF